MITRRGLFSLTAAQAAAAGLTSTRVEAAAAETPFPNFVLTTHEGRRVRFYDDLIKGKIVAINMMYADCTGICPTMTANLRKVQQALGNRVGRDIFMYSISLRPKKDTPEVLKEYVEHHDVGPGWTFLTGRPSEIETLRRRLGFADPDPVVDRDINNHTGTVRYGNDAIGSWGMCAALGPAEQIVTAILWMDVNGSNAYEW